MKTSFLLLLFSLLSFVFKTDEINRLKGSAKKMYAEKKYLEAVKIYNTLETDYKLKDPKLIYDHANACYRSLQLNSASKYYQLIAEGKDTLLASKALNQMGIIACRTNKIKQGKELFIESIRKNPNNTNAILNLEWAFTLKDSTVNNADKTGEKTKDRNSKKKSNNNATNKKNNPEGKNEDSESLRSEIHKNKYMDINKARLILESMKNSERQYVQQIPSKKTPNTNEPNW